ncbi:MAG: D-alanyl-D-alanine carboxypeptidase family protein [Dehalococcoidia bacterium]|nr:D-alanyl-D-alanine carboxypeptidase family protein [Dehalococcoidia bacterium]
MRRFGWLVVVIGALLFVACGGDDEATPEPTAEPTSEPTAVVTEAPSTPTAEPEPVTACVQSMVNDGTEHLIRRADKEQALPDGYEPEVVQLPLAYILAGYTEQYLIAEAAEALMAMLDAASAAGHEVVVRSSYRSYETQVATFAYWVSQVGEAEAERESARAGHSEHQLGQTVDVTSAAVGWQLSQALGDTPEGIWLHAHLAEFGFALSYPPGEEETTGYIYEPWHLRYVGTACAAEWEASGLTLIEVLRGDHLGGVGPSTRS